MAKGKKWPVILVIVIALVLGAAWYGGVFAFIQQKTYVAGDVVEFTSGLSLDCGPCGLSRTTANIDGYVIKVFNPNGNMVKEEYKTKWRMPNQEWYYVCGAYVNTVYEYTIPANPMEGTWTIVLEIAAQPIYDPLPECVVAIDQATFFVGTTCANKEIEVEYCAADQNIRYFKPANSCLVTMETCNVEYGTGYKCVDGKCKLTEICGDKNCDDYETPYNCYTDCGRCGDKLCTGPETPTSCPQDCYSCGDGICADSEWLTCGVDCHRCGDGDCYWYEKTGEAYYCQPDCYPNACKNTSMTCGLLEGICCDGLQCCKGVCASECKYCEWWDVPCQIVKFFSDLFKGITDFFAPLVWITTAFGILISTLISNKNLKGYIKGRNLWIVSIFIGAMVGLLIYLYFWIGVICLIAYALIMNFIPKIGRRR